MLTKDFSYNLPKELIAKNPASPRDSSKLMVLYKDKKVIEHKHFKEMPELLSSDYLLVLNKTKVFPARLKAFIKGKESEILLIKEIKKNIWKCMVKPGKKFKLKEQFNVKGKNNDIVAEVKSIYSDGTREIKFNIKNNIMEWIEFNGCPPFPPYIKDSSSSLNDYQTIYAKETGSIAAPTAGLHFTKRIFNSLKANNINKCFVTLHVGRGTFLSVKSKKIKDHIMYDEKYEISRQCANKLNKAKKEGKRILAVGTTTVRTLESNINRGLFKPEEKDTDLFIYPGYKFKAVDALLTNFHLPQSTLIMLVSAFAGKEFILEAYKEAIRKKYRFYSFGDAMLIL